MSYILDALRKAEHDRHRGRPPHPVTSTAWSPATRHSRWLWVGAGIGLSGNIALLIYLLFRPQPVAEPIPVPAPAPVSVVPAPLETTAPIIAPKAPGVEPLPAAPVLPASVAPLNTPASSPPTPARPSSKVPASASLPPARVPTPVGHERRRELTAKPTAGGPSVTFGPEPPPLLEMLPASARRGLPAKLDIHVYSPDADKRFVVLNGRRYREGESIGEGAVLETVTPAGATVRQGNRRFRLAVPR
ncbi:MAG: general secretion pathway protein GspB [Candidatus Competibacter denitrificans]